MACNDVCCPPHNFAAVVDPTVNDCDESVVPGYVGGYCPGSYWYNNETGVLWIGANDMACGSANWINLNPAPMYHLQVGAPTVQTFLALLDAGYSIAGNKIEYGTVDFESDAGAWDAGTFEFTPPADAIYAISAGITLENHLPDDDVITTDYSIDIIRNGVQVRRLAIYPADQPDVQVVPFVAGATTIQLTTGDTLYFSVAHNLNIPVRSVDTNSVAPAWLRGFMTIDQLV